MGIDRLYAAVWALSFGVATGFIAGSVVQFGQTGGSFQFTLASAALSVGLLYYVLRETSDRWRAETLVFRLGLYFLTVFTVSVSLIRLGTLAVGSDGLLAVVVQLLLLVAGVAAGLWLTFYGGVEWAIDEFTDIDMR